MRALAETAAETRRKTVEERPPIRDGVGMAYYLFCIECPAVTNVCERGWRAFLTDDEFAPAEAAVLCPACAEREFGPPRRLARTDEDA